MSKITARYRASFRTARRGVATTVEPIPARVSQDSPSAPCRGARQLALANFIERQIEAGVFRSYGDAGRRIGMTPGRVTQVMNLLLLTPNVQEQLLTGDLRCGERRLRKTASEPLWKRQAV